MCNSSVKIWVLGQINPPAIKQVLYNNNMKSPVGLTVLSLLALTTCLTEIEKNGIFEKTTQNEYVVVLLDEEIE